MKTITVKTPSNKIEIEIYEDELDVNQVVTNNSLFVKMCKNGCKNFNKKYSCPPFSPSFKSLAKNYKKLYVLMYKVNLYQLNYKDYLKVQLANSVIKSRIDKHMRKIEKDSEFLSSGSCRLCKPCKLKLKQPCKYPDKKRYSLEAVGVDVNDLTIKLFNIPMLWYKDKIAPKYTCVVCGMFK